MYRRGHTFQEQQRRDPKSPIFTTPEDMMKMGAGSTRTSAGTTRQHPLRSGLLPAASDQRSFACSGCGPTSTKNETAKTDHCPKRVRLPESTPWTRTTDPEAHAGSSQITPSVSGAAVASVVWPSVLLPLEPLPPIPADVLHALFPPSPPVGLMEVDHPMSDFDTTNLLGTLQSLLTDQCRTLGPADPS